MKALLDTNILIDYLNGIEAANREIKRYKNSIYISPITWMEVMVGVNSENEIVVRRFLNIFQQVSIDQSIAERAVAIRRKHRIKLPDAIIWACAQSIGALLITRNSKDFSLEEPDVRIPYQL